MGIADCFNDGTESGAGVYSIFRYSGIVDFGNTSIKDTLDKLTACLVDVVFWGRFSHISFGSNYDPPKYNGLDSLYGYIQVNRCFKWKAGDRSPTVKMFQPFTSDALIQRGIHQIDLGYHKGDADDSLNYFLTQPRKWPSGSFYSLNGILSLTYYYPSYCPAGAPCTAFPNTKPPRGFYLSSKTGVVKYYKPKESTSQGWNPIMAVECETYKKDSTGRRVKVSSMVRNCLISAINYADTNKNRYAYTDDFDYTYNVCEEVADTITFNVRDTLAINQTLKDTVDLKWINELPQAVAWVTNPGKAEPNVKIAWTPPKDSYLHHPYTFNIYANEKLCSVNRRYMFRSAEFYTVPKPSFTLKIDTSLCSKLKFSATTKQAGPFKLSWMVYHLNDTIKKSTNLSDSIDLPYAGKWYIRLKVENTLYGCTNAYFDSIVPVNAAISSSLNKQNKKVCKLQNITFTNTTLNNEGSLNYRWFKNNILVSTISSYTTSISDTAKIRFVVSDKRNCKATDSILMTTYADKTVFKLPDTAFCYRTNLLVKAVSPNVKDTIHWFHNNSALATQTLSSSGNYIVRYTDSNACSVNDTFKLQESAPLLSTSLKDTSVCKNNSVQFNLPLNQNISYDSFVWFKNNVIVSQAQNPLIVFNSSANMRVIIYGKPLNIHCKASDTIAVSVYPDSDIQLNVLTKEPCLNNNLFEANKTGVTAFTNLKIDWGDLINQTFSQGIQHGYSDTGVYIVRLFVTTTNQCKDTSSQTVKVLPSPKISFTINDSNQCLNDNLFTLNLNSAPALLQHKIDWNELIPDHNILNGPISHRYSKTSSNIKKFKITVSTDQSNVCKDTAVQWIEIYPNPIIKMNATGFCVGDSTLFSCSQLNSSSIDNYVWTINQQQVSVLKGFGYLFHQTGKYLTILKTVSNLQCEGNDTQRVDILERPKAAFDFTKLQNDINGIPFYFGDKSTHATTREWTVNTTYHSNFTNLQYTFTDTGFAKVKLLVSNQGLCFDSLELIIPVADRIQFFLPNAFSPDNNGINEGFGLSPSQQYLVKEYHMVIFNRWGEKIFDSKDVSQQWQPARAQQGIYLVKLEVRDIYNMFQEISGVVEVLK